MTPVEALLSGVAEGTVRLAQQHENRGLLGCAAMLASNQQTVKPIAVEVVDREEPVECHREGLP